jgi:hypothetical protein
MPYPVDDANVILGGWTQGFSEGPPPRQTVTGKQRVMMGLPHMWDTRCTQREYGRLYPMLMLLVVVQVTRCLPGHCSRMGYLQSSGSLLDQPASDLHGSNASRSSCLFACCVLQPTASFASIFKWLHNADLHGLTVPEFHHWLTTPSAAGAHLAPGPNTTVFQLPPDTPDLGLVLVPPTGPGRDSRGDQAQGLVKPHPTKGWSLADVQVGEAGGGGWYTLQLMVSL